MTEPGRSSKRLIPHVGWLLWLLGYFLLLLLLVAAARLKVLAVAHAVEREPLALEAKIPLGNVRGRIDHVAIDHARQRLFVAELGNNSLGIIDLRGQKVLHRIVGLNEP